MLVVPGFGTGHDEVSNFGTAKDTLQFNATLFANFSAAMADASQVGANTAFAIDAYEVKILYIAMADQPGDSWDGVQSQKRRGNVDAGQLVYPLIAFSHIRCSGYSSPFTQSSQSCHGLSGKSKAPFKSFCTMRATLTRSPMSSSLMR